MTAPGAKPGSGAAPCLLPLVLLGGVGQPAGAAADVAGIAFVNHGGTLSVGRRTIHLWGSCIPPSGEQCQSFERPSVRGPRAVLALEFKIQGFVLCDPKSVNRDGSVNVVCVVGRTVFNPGQDLAAYLLRRGWEVARAVAPIEYRTLEEMARSEGIGSRGIPAVRL